MNNLIIAILLSMSPFSELRGGIPYILLTNLYSLTLTKILFFFILCIIANIMVILPIWIFLDFIHYKLENIEPYRKMANFFLNRIHKKSKELEPRINKYGYIALTLFTAVPLPVTGAWTSSIAVWIIGLNRKKSFLAISLGVIIAGIIVTLLTLSGLNIMNLSFS